MRILLTFLLTFFFINNSFAQKEFDDLIEDIIPKTKLSSDELKLLREELKIQKALIQGVKELDILGVDIKNSPRTVSSIKELIISSFGSRTSSYSSEIQTQIKTAVRNSISDKSITSTLEKLKSFTQKTIHGKTAELASMARRFGLDTGLVYAITMQVDTTLPLILMSQGQVQLGATLLALPISSTTTAAYGLVKKAIKYHQVVKELGGFKNALEHQSIFGKVKDFFHTNIFGRTDLIDLNIAGKNYVFTIQERTLLQRTMTRLGWNDKLNYDNLVKFLKEEHLMHPLLEAIESSNRPTEIKMLRILGHIEHSQNIEVLDKLKNRFSSYINEVEVLPNFTVERTWVLKAANSKSFQELYTHLARVPEGIPPRTFDRLWKNYILVEASKNIGPFLSKDTYQTFRNLYENYSKEVGKDFSLSMDSNMSPTQRHKIMSYFYDSVPQVSACELNFAKLREYNPSF